jgi:hypothetical protein
MASKGIRTGKALGMGASIGRGGRWGEIDVYGTWYFMERI